MGRGNAVWKTSTDGNATGNAVGTDGTRVPTAGGRILLILVQQGRTTTMRNRGRMRTLARRCHGGVRRMLLRIMIHHVGVRLSFDSTSSRGGRADASFTLCQSSKNFGRASLDTTHLFDIWRRRMQVFCTTYLLINEGTQA